MTRPNRRTEWRRFVSANRSDGIEHCVLWRAGYDCRQVCHHERKGEHGVCGDELRLYVRFPPDAQGREDGASLQLLTVALDGHPIRTLDGRALRARSILPSAFHLHCSYPLEEDAVRGVNAGGECDVLRAGKCFGGDGLFSAAETLWTPDDTRALGNWLFAPVVENVVLDLTSGVWSRLLDLSEREIVAAHAANDALPARCPCCEGRGLVARDLLDPGGAS